MRRLFPVLLALALLPAAPALADHLDPEERFTPRDRARARAMVLRSGDLPGFRTQPISGADTHLSCAALDESDLTLTGEAESMQFTAGPLFVSSAAQVYRSRSDANASWRRGTTGAGLACLRSELRREFAQGGARLVSLVRVSFPRVARGSAAYRLVLAGRSQGTTVRVYIDLVVLLHGRAQAAVFFGSALTAPSRADEARLARIVAARMAAAMRGS